MSLNKVVLVGRLTRDPEMRYTASGLAFATFTLAVDRNYKNQQGEKQTDFLRCKAWRQRAEFVNSYIGKGRLVAVEGSIETSEVVGQDGQKKYYTDISCDQVYPLDRSDDAGAGGGAPSGGSHSQSDDSSYNADDTAPQAVPRANRASAPVSDDDEQDARPAARPTRAAAPSDDDDRPAPRAPVAARGGAERGGTPERSAAPARSAGAASAGAASAGAASAGAPRPAAKTDAPLYPEDDFDDSDPFADE